MVIFKSITVFDCKKYHANPLDKDFIALNFKNITVSSFIYAWNIFENILV